MKYASKTDIGKRVRNEDAFRVPSEEESRPLIAVSDGMGGHNGGTTASSMVIEGLGAELGALSLSSDPVGALKSAVQRINTSVFRRAESDPALAGMGATLVCALLTEKHFIAANIGDSRLYHFDGETIEQITTDHSYVEMLAASGQISREEARTHPQRNLITRAVGISLRAELDVFVREWQPGDMLLLCSDGLHGCVEDEAIAEVLRGGAPLEEKCGSLVKLALESGGSDNITVVLALCEGEDCA
ncbi:MAG: Stp1/IreP family PP2C-type Ser/Thr phosphatase [Clostridia bacterium]|nr:Stp1/IreP family PP2C-type Ser/Thr phosphatase [Clostridia bacterium]